jgi:hypothetical protein
MLAVETDSSTVPSADLTNQIRGHFAARKLPLDAIADSDLPVTAADDRYPAWHPDTYPFEAIVSQSSSNTVLMLGQSFHW